MAERVTTMRLKVDLQCEKCYKKVKKVLCKFPQIRDQVFDEKQNIVTIKVVCCSPAKLRDELCCVPCHEGRSGGPCFEVYVGPSPCYKPEKQPAPTCCVPCCEGRPGGPCFEVYVGPPPCYKPEKPPAPTCCVPCSEGRPGGPCFEGYGGPAPCYHGYYYWRPVYHSYGGRRPCYISCCDQYLNEDNATGCTIM